MAPGKKAEIISLGYVGPPLPGYEGTEPKLIGEVRNTGKNVLVGLRIGASAYGKDMKILVDSRDREIAFWVIEEQETSPFCIYLGGLLQSSDEIESVKMTAMEQLSVRTLLEAHDIDIRKSMYRGLEFTHVAVSAETTLVHNYGPPNYYVHGRITNRGDKTTLLNTLIAVFYDSKGSLIDYRKHSISGKSTGGELTSGAARIFRLDVPQEVTRYKGYTYKLKLLSMARE
jgi:hypothetical protein